MEALKRYPSVLHDIADDDPMYVRIARSTRGISITPITATAA